MVFRLTLFVISLLSVLQVWYRSTLVSVFAKPILQVNDYESFSKESNIFFLCAGLFLLLSCFLSSRKNIDEVDTSSSHHWVGSFMVVLGICAGLILTVNPEGRFPWNQRDTYSTIAAHSIKSNLYKKLGKTPELIIMGSSISFTAPASYFKKKWGTTAFNMSFNSGGPVDFLRSLNYVIQKSPDGKVPSTVLVEILSPGIRIGIPTQTPVELLPYLSLDQVVPAAGAILDHLVLSSSLSNTVFTLLFLDTHRWQPPITFADDGTGIVSDKTQRDYEISIKNDIPLGMDLLSCKNQQLNSLGKAYIEKLIDLANTYHFSIIFYRPPINRDLYTLSNTEPNSYAYCRNLFNTYMQTLVKENQNIFYRDLSNHPKISKMGLKIYMDTHHLNTYGNKLVLQALNKEIEAALAWAKSNHRQAH